MNFCLFRYNRMNLFKGRCLLIQRYFCTVYDYAVKVDLSKGYSNPKRILCKQAVKSVTMYGGSSINLS